MAITLRNQCKTCAEIQESCEEVGDLCNFNASSSGGDEGYEQTFTNLLDEIQLIKWRFNAYSVKDGFIVGGDVTPAVNTGCVSGEFEGYFVLEALGVAVVKVDAACAGGGTAWNFSLNCINLPTSSVSYNEVHGFDECPRVLPPCYGGTPVPGETCAGRTIGPLDLEFPETIPEEIRNLGIVYPAAAITYQADNFGFASGASGEVGCNGTNACVICSQSGVIEPFFNSSTGKYFISAYAQNAPHGGPYSLIVSATLTFQSSPV